MPRRLRCWCCIGSGTGEKAEVVDLISAAYCPVCKNAIDLTNLMHDASLALRSSLYQMAALLRNRFPAPEAPVRVFAFVAEVLQVGNLTQRFQARAIDPLQMVPHAFLTPGGRAHVSIRTVVGHFVHAGLNAVLRIESLDSFVSCICVADFDETSMVQLIRTA
jgi:hypothetical protein